MTRALALLALIGLLGFALALVTVAWEAVQIEIGIVRLTESLEAGGEGSGQIILFGGTVTERRPDEDLEAWSERHLEAVQASRRRKGEPARGR